MNTIERPSPQPLYTCRVRGTQAQTVVLHTLAMWDRKINEYLSYEPESCPPRLHDAHFICSSLIKSAALGKVYIAYNTDGHIKGICEIMRERKVIHVLYLLSSPEAMTTEALSASSSEKSITPRTGAGAVLLAHIAKKRSVKKLSLVSLSSAVDFYKHIGFKVKKSLNFSIKGGAKNAFVRKYQKRFTRIRDVRSITLREDTGAVKRHPLPEGNTEQDALGNIPSLLDIRWREKELVCMKQCYLTSNKDIKKITQLPLAGVQSITINTRYLNIKQLKKISDKFASTLKSLTLFNCRNMTDLTGCVFPVLNVFSASGTGITDNALTHLAQTSPGLTKLKLEHCQGLCSLTNETFPSLKEIALTNCLKISNDGLKNITRATPSLQFFILDTAPRITSIDGCLFNEWTNLEYFYFSGTSVSRDALADLELKADIEIPLS